MSLSDKNRKILWGKSGNRCAICKIEMTMDHNETDKESIVGDECHIVSMQPKGPRYREDFPWEEHDSLKNLILLCKNHHKQVDDQHDTFSETLLITIKDDHENWVRRKLSDSDEVKPVRIRRIKENIPGALFRITTGKALLSIALNSCAAYFDYDDIDLEEIRSKVSAFCQNIQDWVDVGINDIADRMEAEKYLTDDIEELDKLGYWVFGAKEEQVIEGGVVSDKSWPVFHLLVISKDNENVVKLG